MNNHIRNDVLTKFYLDTQRELHKRVSNRAGGAYNAEDVVQEAFARALKYWDTYDPNNKELGAWFNTILNNTLKDFKRGELMYGMCIEFDENLYKGTELSLTNHHMVGKVKQLIEDKRDHTREILSLYYLKGYKPQDIEQILDVSNKSIRMAVWRFKDEVKEKLNV